MSQVVLHIITPITRPHNLNHIYESLQSGLRTSRWCWWCVFDMDPPRPPLAWQNIAYWGRPEVPSGRVGHPQRNWALDQIKDGWVYFLDDDNLLHPYFEKAWLEAMKRHPKSKWFLFLQVRRSGEVYLLPTEKPTVGKVDTGQGVIARDAIGNWRFPFPWNYWADGEFFEFLARSVMPTCVDVPATYYNALR